MDKWNIISEKFVCNDANKNNNYDYEIKAGGVIFYHKFYDNKKNLSLKLLMIEKKKERKIIWEDFGGKRNKTQDSIKQVGDIDVYDMVSREVNEESNNYFDRNKIYEIIKNKNFIYSIRGKYVIFLVELDNLIDCSIFGNYEINTNISREVKWINAKTFCKKSTIHPRLKYCGIKSCIMKLMTDVNSNDIN